MIFITNSENFSLAITFTSKSHLQQNKKSYICEQNHSAILFPITPPVLAISPFDRVNLWDVFDLVHHRCQVGQVLNAKGDMDIGKFHILGWLGIDR